MTGAIRSHATLLMGGTAFALCMLAAVPGSVGAQGSADDKAAAEALFDQGLSHMREGKLEQACGELERSQSLERGVGTMLYLAECYEKLGRSASAWALFREASSVAAAQGEGERARVGASRADRLEPVLSRLTLQVAAENRIEGFELSRNGQPVRAATWGAAVPVDPGQHVLAASAPGKLSWTQTVTVQTNGQRLEVQVPALAVDPAAQTPVMLTAPPPGALDPNAAPGSATPAPASGVPVPALQPQMSAAPEAHDEWPMQRTIGLVVGAAGVVALGVGGYFGLRAFDKNDEAEQYCPEELGGQRCNDELAVTRTDEAETAATLSSVFMIGGAALAAAGVVLYVTAPSEQSPSLALRAAPGDVRMTLAGAF